MSITSEFKEFLARGNVVDLAVGVIIGGAFGKIVSTLVDNVIMPPIGLMLGGVDFSDIKVVLKAADEVAKTPEVAMQIGTFGNALIQFVIVAFVVFMLVKAVNRLRAPAAAPADPGPTPSEVLLAEIRDALKK